MRVLFIISSLGLGGLEKQVVDLVRGLDPSRVESRTLVFNPGGERLRDMQKSGMAVSEAGGGSAHRFVSRWKAIRRECLAFRPHIIVAFDIAAALYMISTVGRRKDIFRIAYFGAGTISTPKAHLAFRCLHPFLDRIIANSHRGAEYLRRSFGIGADRGGVICNGLDVDAMNHPWTPVGSLRKELSIPDHVPLVGLIGKLDWFKDPMNLAMAAAMVRRQVPDVEFCFIGFGPLHEEVSAYLATQNLTAHFHLVPQRPDAPWLAGEFTIGALCSRSEGLPNVVLEYMYWSLPCVVTDTGECGRLVADGETGYVVPPRNPEALANAILRHLSDPERARAMGRKGRQRLEEHYSIRRFIREFQDVFDSGTSAE